MLCTDNLVPMILAKTLNGLDDLKDSVCDNFKGSPLLLQVALHLFLFCSFTWRVIIEKYSSFFLFFFFWNFVDVAV